MIRYKNNLGESFSTLIKAIVPEIFTTLIKRS